MPRSRRINSVRPAIETIDCARFARLWASGQTTLGIAREFGRSHGTWASRIAARLGLPARDRRQRREVDRSHVIAAREDGLTIVEIASEIGCDPQQVRNALDSMCMSANGPEDPIYGLD